MAPQGGRDAAEGALPVNLTAGQRARLVVALGLLNVILVGAVLTISGVLEPRPLTRGDGVAGATVTPAPTAPWSPAPPTEVAFATPFPTAGSPTPPLTGPTPTPGGPEPTPILPTPTGPTLTVPAISPLVPTAAATTPGATLARPPAPTERPATAPPPTAAPPRPTAKPATEKPARPARTPKPKPAQVGPSVPCPGSGPPGHQHGNPEPRPCGQGGGRGAAGFLFLAPLLGAGVLVTGVRRMGAGRSAAAPDDEGRG